MKGLTRIALACLLLSACGKPPESSGPRYGAAPPPGSRPVCRLAVHPSYNPGQLAEAYQPLIDLLNRRIPDCRFELEASRDYADFERKIRRRTPALLLPNPLQTLEALDEGYQVLAMVGDAEDFRGIFLVRRDSDIRQPADLKGRAVAYPAHTALAACIMPQWFLYQRGLDPVRDIENHYVGSQESAIMNVLLGQVAAGVTWPPPWRLFQRDHPARAAELRVIWQTAPLISNSLMIRSDLASRLGVRLRAVLLGLRDSEEGRRVLSGMETSRFIRAGDSDYAVVRAFMERFESHVRRVDIP